MAQFSAHARGGHTVAPGSVMPVAQRYWVHAPCGALARAGMDLDSDEVGDVDSGAAVSVMGFAQLASGKRRARLLHPVRGWVSAALLRPGAAPAYSLRDRPRVLCLHGGGTSGAIFRAQLHAVVSDLAGVVVAPPAFPFFSSFGRGARAA